MKHFFLSTMLLLFIYSYAQPNVVEVEYFLDFDLGFGMNQTIPVTTPDVNIEELVMSDIPISTTTGYHKLYIRTKDALGNWSQTVRKNIEVFSSVTVNNIVNGEYFIDLDPQFSAGNTFTIDLQSEDVAQAFEAQILASTSLGYHKLYGRIQDSNGNWSHTFRKNIEVYLNPVTNLVEIEYFFVDESDSGFGNNNNINIDVPEMDGIWSFDVSYPEGNYDLNDCLFVRVKDSNNHWSITTKLDEIGTLSINDNFLSVASMSPNPFKDKLNIDVTNELDFELIKVFDLTGKIVYQSSENLRVLNLENLEAGTYILSIQTETEKATFKIIKQ